MGSPHDSDVVMRGLWEKIEGYLQSHECGSLSTSLSPGASEAEVATAESALGDVRFPQDYRAFLKLHNGQVDCSMTLLGMGPLLSTHEIVDQWRVWKELLDDGTFDDQSSASDHTGVKTNMWWNPRWIPITHDGGGDHDCIDLDPGEGGTAGQIIEMFHDMDDRSLIAPSFTAWVAHFVAELEQGNLVWSNVDWCFQPRQHNPNPVPKT